MSRLIPCLVLLALACSPAAAQDALTTSRSVVPKDFSWQWPLATTADDDLLQLELEPQIYARLWRDDLQDLVIFNAADEMVPMATLDHTLGQASAAAARLPRPVAVPLFRIPTGSEQDASERLRLIVVQGTGGRLEALDARDESHREPSHELLLDLSALESPVQGLVLELEEGIPPLVARIDVFGSRDLSRWTRLAAGQALVALRENELRLVRNRIEFAATNLPYLRLVRTDARAALPVRAARALPRAQVQAGTQELARKTLQGTPDPLGSATRFQTPGPIPVRRIEVLLAGDNAAASAIIESRAGSSLPWRERARGAVFQMGRGEDGLRSTPFEIAPIRDREWRVRLLPDPATAPTLAVEYVPDRFVFLAREPAPFRLAAGSARSQRGDYPLQAMLFELRSRHGADWLPARVELLDGAELAGKAALAPRPDDSDSAGPLLWLLWGLLLAGAFLVLVMVLRLLRQSGDA